MSRHGSKSVAIVVASFACLAAFVTAAIGFLDLMNVVVVDPNTAFGRVAWCVMLPGGLLTFLVLGDNDLVIGEKVFSQYPVSIVVSTVVNALIAAGIGALFAWIYSGRLGEDRVMAHATPREVP